MIVKCSNYPIRIGEPQLGSERECVYIWDREEIIEAIVELIESGCVESVKRNIDIGDSNIYATVELSEYMSSNELAYLNLQISEKFIDDDFGSDKYFHFLNNYISSIIPDDATHEEVRNECY